MENAYVPGVCNIGPAETAMRRRVGWIGTAITVILFAALLSLGAHPYWRLILALPAMLAAAGFLQAHFRFCAAYGKKGQFNFGPQVGTRETVADAAASAPDRKRANQIFGYSVAIGILVAVVACLI